MIKSIGYIRSSNRSALRSREKREETAEGIEISLLEFSSDGGNPPSPLARHEIIRSAHRELIYFRNVLIGFLSLRQQLRSNAVAVNDRLYKSYQLNSSTDY